MQTLYYSTLQTSPIDGVAVTAASATSLLPAVARYTFPANFFWFPGQVIRVRSAGRITTAASTPGTVTFDVRLGSVVVFNGGASQTLQVSKTNVTWEFDATLTLRAADGTAITTANFLGIGHFMSEAISATANLAATMMLPTSAAAVGSNFDSIATQQLDNFVTFSAATNSITCHQFQLDSSI
jgi:hypothetical protein